MCLFFIYYSFSFSHSLFFMTTEYLLYNSLYALVHPSSFVLCYSTYECSHSCFQTYTVRQIVILRERHSIFKKLYCIFCFYFNLTAQNTLIFQWNQTFKILLIAWFFLLLIVNIYANGELVFWITYLPLSQMYYYSRRI